VFLQGREIEGVDLKKQGVAKSTITSRISDDLLPARTRLKDFQEGSISAGESAVMEGLVNEKIFR